MAPPAADLDVHRPALTGHCYRMLGSPFDADDAVQETMVRAWRHLDSFDGRSSLRTWLYRIATNVCLDALNERSRRERPIEAGPEGTVDDALGTRDRTHWLEPVPEARVLPTDADPAHVTALRESIRLAFVAALQHLPPRQRAALLLTEVLDCSAAEVAATLDTTTASVTSALQRARATLATRDLGTPTGTPLSGAEAELVDRYVGAFERFDVDGLTSLLREDATLSMPPHALWLRGPAALRAWWLGPGGGCRGSRLVPVAASGAPAFGQYREGGRQPWAIIVLDMAGGRLTGITSFLDVDTLFPLFGLPPRLAS